MLKKLELEVHRNFKTINIIIWDLIWWSIYLSIKIKIWVSEFKLPSSLVFFVLFSIFKQESWTDAYLGLILQVK